MTEKLTKNITWNKIKIAVLKIINRWCRSGDRQKGWKPNMKV